MSYFLEKFDAVVSSVSASEIHWLQPPLSYIPVYPQKYDTTNTKDIISKSKGWSDKILPEVTSNELWDFPNKLTNLFSYETERIWH